MWSRDNSLGLETEIGLETENSVLDLCLGLGLEILVLVLIWQRTFNLGSLLVSR